MTGEKGQIIYKMPFTGYLIGRIKDKSKEVFEDLNHLKNSTKKMKSDSLKKSSY